ncbi:MAG: UvrD-helicase domain-containing protein [Rhodocyclaceae bacterium]|nr:UvrD-helicase domain-containing protein [Rhodocyclaceae bacterium]
MTADARLLAEDAASRARALEPASFIVEAPAGAGKTELLTQRYLRLLAHVAEPEEIVAITFTNKAAAEMRHRILESLELARCGAVPEAAHKRITFALSQAALAASERHGWALADNPGRLRIMTIDALCASLARQMPILSRFGAQPSVTDDAARHYEEAARRTLALLNDEGAAAAAVAAALRHLDNDAQALGRLLAAMLARRDQWLRHALGASAQSEQGLHLLVARDLALAATAVGDATQARLMPLARYAAGNLAATAPLATLAGWNEVLAGAPEELPLWRGICELLLTKDGGVRKVVDVRSGFPAGKEGKPFKDAMSALLAEFAAGADTAAVARIRALPDARYTADEWHTVDALAQLLRLAAAQLWTVFHEANETDFIEIAQRALEALGGVESPSDLALRLDYRLQHLLVDEFQDTSPTQVELLRRLTAGWAPDDGRTLFAVGDPMQSIYRFRKADVGLFLRAAESGIGPLPLERLRLTRNNRSCAPVVDWVNAAFATVFPRHDSVTAGAIAYRPFAATRADLPAAGVATHAIVIEREDQDEAAALEARRVLEIIDGTRRADPQRHIAVLVRARHHLAALVAEIRRHRPDIAFRAVEIEALAERQPVQDLLALTRALLHRADRVHWLAILRAPWCGLRLADLHALAADDHEATLWSLMNEAERVARLSPDGQARLAHVRAALGGALAQRGRQRLARWIEGAWLALGGAGCLRDAADAADARAYLDLVDRLDAAGRFSLERIEADMAALYAAPDAAADGTLQFMTIHKSKGLEFDTVILPGLHRRGRGDDAPLMRWEEVALEGLDECLVAAPLRRRGDRNTDVPTPFDYIGLLERERAANEAARVLYVAATRAVRALHLVGVAVRRADGEVVAPAGTFLGLLWDAVGAQFAAAELALPSRSGADDEAGMFVPKLIRAVAPATPEVLRAPAAPTAGAIVAAAAAAAAAGEPLDAGVGTLVHAYLEAIARSGPDAWPPERVRALAPAMRAWFARRAYGAADGAKGAERAQAALLATLESSAGRWVLAPRAEAAAELTLASRAGDGIATQVVDRTFVEGGQRWIVDYKTARIDGDAAALAAHAEAYRAQLERYAALFADEGLPVRLGVFYAASGRLVELQPAT